MTEDTKRAISPTNSAGKAKTKKVKTLDGDVVVRKLAMRDYADLLAIINTLPATIQSVLKGKTEDELKERQKQGNWVVWLPELMLSAAKSFGEVAEIMALASDKDKEFYLDGDMADAIEVAAAILEVNDYQRILASIKKITARKKSTQSPQKVESKG